MKICFKSAPTLPSKPKVTTHRLPTKNGLLDWDCAEALSIPDIVSSLKHIHTNGTFPVSSPSLITHPLSRRTNHGIPNKRANASQPTLDSKEDQNSVGTCPVPDSTISELKNLVKSWTEEGQPGHILLTSHQKICILDGFLLYTPTLASLQPLIDIKLFLRTSHALAKARREARSGYVTLEGFWEDPPGYVDL